MKVLLDENLPHDLRQALPGLDVFTVRYQGWSGLKNGALLAKAGTAGFDAMITMDSGVPYQQNLATLPVAVVVLKAPSNDMSDLLPLVPRLLKVLRSLKPGTVVAVG